LVVSKALWVASDNKEKEWDALANLIINLLRENYISHESIVKGLETFLTEFEENIVDAPLGPRMLGIIIGRFITSDSLKLMNLNSILQPLVETGFSETIFLEVLSFIKEDTDPNNCREILKVSKLELSQFLIPEKAKDTNYISKILDQKDLLDVFPELFISDMIIVDKKSIAEIVDWLKINVTEIDVDLAKKVVQSVLEIVIQSKEEEKQNQTLLEYLPLFNAVIPADNIERQTACLFEIQQFCVSRDQIKNKFMKRIFEALHYNEVIKNQALFKWKDDDSEHPGKQDALFQLNAYISNLLKDNEEEEEEENIDDENDENENEEDQEDK